ncbi:MAG: hypothetical protein JWO48_109 [Bryobacterales bacterium]|nr:hypothetical protein [Bryobacterales bacterium]
MKTVISMASMLACAFSLDAQITATLNGGQVRIKNNSSTGLVAFVVALKRVAWSPTGDIGPSAANRPNIVYSDPLIETTETPLLPNQERIVQPLSPSVFSIEQPILTAGVFADGSVMGDAGLLTRLMLRRSNTLLAVETASETLSDAGRRNVSRDQLVAQFKKMADFVSRGYLLQEQKIGLGIYQPIIGKLINLPEMKDGSPFPPAGFVEQETAILRQRRIALLESLPNLFSLADEPLNSK